MKKLFFAAFAAFVMVSVSNVFANNSAGHNHSGHGGTGRTAS